MFGLSVVQWCEDTKEGVLEFSCIADWFLAMETW